MTEIRLKDLREDHIGKAVHVRIQGNTFSRLAFEVIGTKRNDDNLLMATLWDPWSGKVQDVWCGHLQLVDSKNPENTKYHVGDIVDIKEGFFIDGYSRHEHVIIAIAWGGYLLDAEGLCLVYTHEIEGRSHHE
jgi:hypothetical protein